MSQKQIEESTLWPEIRQIIQTSKKPTRRSITGMVHNEKEGFPIYKINSVDTVCDYAGNIADVIQIEFRLLFGDYVKRLFPFRDNLEVTLKRQVLIEGTNKPDPEFKIEPERYKAIFLTDENIVVDTSEFKAIDYESLNKMDIVTVKLQLMNRFFEPFRVKMVSGVYQKVTQKQLLHSLTGGENIRIQVDGQNPLQGLDIVDPDNQLLRSQVMIPDNKLVVNIPTFLQEESGGLYNAGVGSYFAIWEKKRFWFIYPLYKSDRFDGDVKKVIFYSLPESRFQGVNRTYREDGKTLKIACTSSKRYIEATDQINLNEGVGFRMADARGFMTKPVQIKEEGPVGKRVNLNHEVGMVYRNDGMNFAKPSANKISCNPYVEYSRFMQRQMARVDLVWEHSNPELLHPGMPCKFIFLEGETPKELRGTILFVHHMEAPISTESNEKIFETISHVTIATETYKFQPDKPKANAIGVF